MIPRLNQRIWIIVFWYLLLQCHFPNIIPLQGTHGSSTVDERTHELRTDGRLENLYHRILDNDEFTGMIQNAHIEGPNVATKQLAVENRPATTSRRRPWPHGADDGPALSRAISHKHQINRAYSNLDNIFNPVQHDGEQEEHAARLERAPGGEASDREVTLLDANRMSNVPHSLRARTGQHWALVDQISEKYAYANKRLRRSVDGEGAEKALQASAEAAPEASSPATVPLTADASIPSTIANGDDVSSRDTIFSPAHMETAADISIHAIDYANVGASESSVQRSPSRRTDDAHSSDSAVQVDAGVQAVSSNNAKVSNLGQLISSGVAVGHLKMDSTKQKGHGEGSPEGTSRASENTDEQSSALPEPSEEAAEPKERAITTSHSSVTSDSLRYGVGVRADPSGGAIGDRGASFILLDDSVYISPGHGLLRNGSQAVPDLPSAGTDLTLDSSIFGGRNFDEQIIFLNGPDLLETSVEQESSSPPVHRPVAQPRPTPQRQMGKVARAVQLHGAEDDQDDPLALPLRPIVRDPADAAFVAEDNVVVMYADQHETVRVNCEVDADITTSVWLKDGQIVHATDKKSRTADIRFVRESFGGLTIRNVMLEDDGVWQCEAENARGFFFNGRPIKLIVLDPPKEPYLLIDSRQLDAGNMFIPVKENSELTLACVTEGGNPKPMLTWEVLLSPGIDRHAQKLPNDVLELEEIKKDKDKELYKINSGAVSEAKLAAVFRVHHNARILCIMEHPTLKVRQNASILLDVQYTPSFAITRTPGFGYPLREGIEVSLKCDVDSNPPSTPLWQKDDGDTPVPQIGDGFLNFSSIRREHSGWYKCTSRHLNFQYSSIGYYLSVRYEPVDVTSEPVEQDLSLSPSLSSASASSSSSSFTSALATNGAGSFKNSAPFGSFPAGFPIGSSSFKPGGQMEVELGGSVTLQCPQGSLGCWSHLDSATVRLKGTGGSGGYGQTGQVSLKDVVYQDAGTYKCVGQSATNRKKLDVPQTVKAPTVSARNATPSVLPGTSLHLSAEFCANPPAYAARWLHGDRVYTPGNQYGTDVVAYGLTDLPTPFCKEARLTYVHMHENVPRRFYFIVSSPGGAAEAVFKVNYTLRHKATGSTPARSSGKNGNSFSSSSGSPAPSAPSPSSSSSGAANVNGGLAGYKLGGNTIDSVPGNGEELMEPEEIHFPIFGSGGGTVRLGLPGAVATLAPLLHWHRILYALPLLLPLLPLTTL